MSDLISREKLWKRITSTYDEGLSLDELRSEIDEMPTAEPVKHGRWIWDDEGYHCSECFFHAYGETLNVLDETYKYCPYCGAKMDGGEEV